VNNEKALVRYGLPRARGQFGMDFWLPEFAIPLSPLIPRLPAIGLGSYSRLLLPLAFITIVQMFLVSPIGNSGMAALLETLGRP